MKYLRKIFESDSTEQLEEVEAIFTEFLDERQILEDGEEYPTCEIKIEQKYIRITIYKEECVQNANGIVDFENLVKGYDEQKAILNRLKTPLKRIDHLGYKWGIEIWDNEIHIKIFFIDNDFTLLDALTSIHGSVSIDPNIIKTVLKDKYNVEYSSFNHSPGSSGYYGRKETIYLYLRDTITNDSKLYRDIKDLKHRKKNDDDRYERSVFSRVEIVHDGKTLKLEY